MTDVVYICRRGEENEELRYSLRSLRNLPHDRVWLAGAKPSWVAADLIEGPAVADKQESALANLIAALEHPGISDPFYLFNDDFYVMLPIPEIPMLHLGPLTEFIAGHAQGSRYRKSMQATYDRLIEVGSAQDPPMSYELHAPMPIEKLGMQLALSLGHGIYGMHLRTMYGNLMGIGGDQVKDVKVYRADKGNAYASWPLLSTSDRTFKYHPAGRYIRTSFTDPSPYEKPQRIRPVSRAIRYRSVITNP